MTLALVGVLFIGTFLAIRELRIWRGDDDEAVHRRRHYRGLLFIGAAIFLAIILEETPGSPWMELIAGTFGLVGLVFLGRSRY